MLTPFRNEPYVNFAEEIPAGKMREALRAVEARLGARYPVVIGGKPIGTDGWIASTNPANPSQVIGEVGKATPAMAVQAIEQAHAAFDPWRKTPAEARARCLLRAAAEMRRRIYEFSAWLSYEVSKSWIEAYADTAEAIDFMELYAREAIRLDGAYPTTPAVGEQNEVRYIPLGVGVVISPWNFPLAILAGMTTAALAAGNTVVMKPASQSPVIAALLFNLLRDAGVPEDVVAFVPGPGGAIGDALVDHPLTRFVSFTGSRDVGIRIHQRAAAVHPGQIWLKRTVLEMGGKDAIIVDASVDVDAAADGVVAAAFGFQGQKCSACSRLIAHDAIHDELLEKVAARASVLTMGDPTTGNPFMGAVIEDNARRKIEEYITIGRSEGRIVLGETPAARLNGGHFVAPTIVAGIKPTDRLAQEEVFGPVLAVIRADSFDHSMEIANGTEYGLTGAIFSNDPDHLEIARRDFHVGNLYLNRKCTGALVDVQPFGGFNMSGTDSKAGGRDYLQLFLQAKSICERL